MAQQPQMNMPQLGGPVQNAGTPNSGQPMEHEMVMRKLNTAIYDYLLRNELYSVARDFSQHVTIEKKEANASPGQRGGQQANGINDMDLDSKDQGLLNKPDDLFLPANVGGDGPFLQDWWCQFWEIFQAHRKRGGHTPQAAAYMEQQRRAQNNRMGMMNINQANMRMNPNMMQANGVMPDNVRRAAMQNNRNLTPQQLAQMQSNMKAAAQNGQMMQGANQMERQGSQMDNRTGSPGSGDAPSPKRQRLEGGGMQQMNQGRPGQPGQMQQGNQGMPPNMGPGGAQGSPMSQPGMDGATADFYAAAASANGAGRIPMQNNGGAVGAAGQSSSNGNHALQDYQMQLMLLEQQNKKRLLMARQEQDSLQHTGGVGNNGGFPPGSPGPGMIDPNSIPPQLRNQMMMGQGQVLRPPSSHPSANMTPEQLQMMRAQGMQMPNGQFPPGQQPPGPMMPGQPGQGPQGTPRQANNNMPPPPAPQANAAGTGPSSPAQQPPAPPTPSTTNKAKPGNKKEAAKKGAAAKKAANVAPATESEHPPTPTPPTPATPQNAQSFGRGQGNQPNGATAPTSNPPNAQAGPNAQQGQAANQPNAAQQPDPAADLGPFGNLDAPDFSNFGDLSIPGMDNGDMLDTFDFESFLNEGPSSGFDFDANLAFDGNAIGSGIEGAN